MTKAEKAKRRRQAWARAQRKNPVWRKRVRESTKRGKAKMKAEVIYAREHQGRLLPMRLDLTAPRLYRRVPGLTEESWRSVRINGFPLTLVETP